MVSYEIHTNTLTQSWKWTAVFQDDHRFAATPQQRIQSDGQVIPSPNLPKYLWHKLMSGPVSRKIVVFLASLQNYCVVAKTNSN